MVDEVAIVACDDLHLMPRKKLIELVLSATTDRCRTMLQVRIGVISDDRVMSMRQILDSPNKKLR